MTSVFSYFAIELKTKIQQIFRVKVKYLKSYSYYHTVTREPAIKWPIVSLR